MENKINIVELLKDCPRGMELDCTICNGVNFIELDKNPNYPIVVRVNNGYEFSLTKYGQVHNMDDAKCVIFPKGKTTWEGFVPPCQFKDGDVLVHTQNDRFVMSIYKSNESKIIINTYAIFWDREEGLSVGKQICCYTDSTRFATEEEKKKLFQAIKDNGYKWNAETKTLEKLIESKEDTHDEIVMSGIYFDRKYYADEVELHLGNYEIEIRDGNTYAIFKNQETKTLKPKFKVGNVVMWKHYVTTPKTIKKVQQANDGNFNYWIEGEGCIPGWCREDELHNKFDITTLKPFDKVLVRDFDNEVWEIDFFSKLLDGKHFKCHGAPYVQCIPYKGNEHLHNSTDACNEFYETWKK